MRLYVVYANKNKAQKLTFPKDSSTSAASSMELVFDVRNANVSAVDREIQLAFRLSEARLNSPPHR